LQGKSEVLDFGTLNKPTRSSGKSNVQPIPRFAEALDFLLPRRDPAGSVTDVISRPLIQQLALFGLIGGLGFRQRRPPGLSLDSSSPPGWFHVLTFSAETRLAVPK
jgi:hypothetical protein